MSASTQAKTQAQAKTKLVAIEGSKPDELKQDKERRAMFLSELKAMSWHEIASAIAQVKGQQTLVLPLSYIDMLRKLLGTSAVHLLKIAFHYGPDQIVRGDKIDINVGEFADTFEEDPTKVHATLAKYAKYTGVNYQQLNLQLSFDLTQEPARD